MFCTFTGITSVTLDSKLCNLITSWELIKAPQNVVHGSISMKSLKLCHKNKGGFLASILLKEHLFRRTSEGCSVIKSKNHWNVLLSIFMFSCANLYNKYAQSNSYWVLNFKSVKIIDEKSTPIWISHHFQTCKHLNKLDQKAIWLFSVSVNFHIRLHVKTALVELNLFKVARVVNLKLVFTD